MAQFFYKDLNAPVAFEFAGMEALAAELSPELLDELAAQSVLERVGLMFRANDSTDLCDRVDEIQSVRVNVFRELAVG